MAGDPGGVKSISVSGDFITPQYVNKYIDCLGLTFTVGINSGSDVIVYGDSFVNGVATFKISSPYAGNGTITAIPLAFTATGEQTVTFRATNTLSPGYANTTKNVTVQSSSITKNLYGFLADGRKVLVGTVEKNSSAGYNVTFPANMSSENNETISINDGTPISLSSFVSQYAGQTVSNVSSITIDYGTPLGIYSVTANTNFIIDDGAPSAQITNDYSDSFVSYFKINFLADTTFTTFTSEYD